MGNLTHTVSGDIASFRSAARVPIESLKCHFLPVQEGTGDPSPENVRPISGWQGLNIKHCTINLFNKDEDYSANNFYYNFDGTTTINNQYRTTGYIKIKPNTTYFWAINGVDGVTRPTHSAPRVAFFDINKTWIGSSSNALGSGNKATSPANAVYARLPVFVYYPDSVASAMFIEGETRPTRYEPYRGQTIPITFPVLGKNKLNPVWELGAINTNNGELQTSTTSIRLKNKIDIIPSTTYALSWSGDNRNIFRFAYHQDGTFSRYLGLQSVSDSSPMTFNSDEYYFSCYQYNVIEEPNQMQLEIGTSATTYEPYSSNNTVYGGYVDIAKGELVQEYVCLTLDENIPLALAYNSRQSLTTRFYTSTNYVFLGADHDLNKSCFIDSATYGANFDDKVRWYRQGNSEFNIYIPNELTGITSEDSDNTLYDKAHAYLAQHPINYIFALQNPIIHYLSSIQLKTFLNQNYIWSNTNDTTEVSYAIHDSALIQAAKKQIIINEPHIETVSGTIANFNTDMSAPLKECRIYFNPMQEGNGEPSSENIREINGWTGLHITACGKNLLNPILKKRAEYQNTQTWGHDSGTQNINGEFILSPNTYTLSISNMYENETPMEWAVKDNEGNYLVHTYSGKLNRTFTLTATTAIGIYMSVPANSISALQNYVMLEVGTASSNYEPYNGQTLLLDWQNDIGDIYGGYIDIITGELYQTWYKANITDYTWNKWGSLGLMYVNHTNTPRKAGTTVYCNAATITGSGDPQRQAQDIIGYYGTDIRYPSYFFIQTNIDTSTTEGWTSARQHIADVFANVYVIYELETPQLITTLTPIQLKSLISTNNIWSDANGPITVQYWTH